MAPGNYFPLSSTFFPLGSQMSIGPVNCPRNGVFNLASQFKVSCILNEFSCFEEENGIVSSTIQITHPCSPLSLDLGYQTPTYIG